MGEPDCWLDLYWIPVGAGTRFQRASLLFYEAVAAWIARRPRKALVHAGLVGSQNSKPFTVELMPSPAGRADAGEVTGPVGFRLAGRLRLFRYQVCILDESRLPDQEWAVEPPSRLTEDGEVVGRVLAQSRLAPAYTWGRRRNGHPEMWTSDSTAAWILSTAGIDTGRLGPPPGTRAPGWQSGILEAGRSATLAG